MSYVNRVYKQKSIARMCFVEGNGLTASNVKEKVGCNDILNAAFYGTYKDSNGKTYLKPSFHLKNEGKVLADPGWKYTGILWDIVTDSTPLAFHMGAVPDSSADNYISGYILLGPNNTINDPLDKNIPSRLTKRGRTLIGMKANGDIVIHICGDGTSDAKTAAQCRQYMYDLGCTICVMLDGGGSSQCDLTNTTKNGIVTSGQNLVIKSTRAVYNYLCIWYAPDPEPVPETVTYYRVQVGAFTNVNNAKRLQAELKNKGYASCYIQSVIINGVTYHRVQVGSFSVRANADRLMAELKQKGYSPFIQTVEIPKK